MVIKQNQIKFRAVMREILLDLLFEFCLLYVCHPSSLLILMHLHSCFLFSLLLSMNGDDKHDSPLDMHIFDDGDKITAF